MSTADWIHYKCMTGQTLFIYNKVTGEHRFPKGDKKGSSKTSIMYSQPMTVQKEFHTVGTQTDDYGCDNGCSSIYATKNRSHVPQISETPPQPQQNVSVDSGTTSDNEHGAELEQSQHPESAMEDRDEQHQSHEIDEMSTLLGVLKELEMPTGSNLSGNNTEARNDSVNDVEKTAEKHLHATKGPCPTKSNQSFKCSHCEKQFSCNSQLIVHQRIHSGEKPFQCSFCGKKFTATGNLKRHLATHSDKAFQPQRNKHSGEKPCKCPQCGKTFLYKCNLTVHLRIHTGEKPYECSTCNKKFGDRSGYNKHLRRHSGLKPFECVYCGMKCAFKSDLKQHVKSHSQEKPFECSYCEKTFKRNDHLKRHLKTH